MSDKEYLSFDEVISDLHMEEEELKRLVSAGEIRAFRDQDTMRFKAADISRLKSDDGDDLDLGDELELTDDLDLETQVGDTEELILEDDLGDLGGDVEELDLGGGDEAAESSPRRRAPRSQAAEPEEASEGGLVLTTLIVGMLILIFANFAALGAVAGQTNGLTNFLAQLFA